MIYKDSRIFRAPIFVLKITKIVLNNHEPENVLLARKRSRTFRIQFLLQWWNEATLNMPIYYLSGTDIGHYLWFLM